MNVTRYTPWEVELLVYLRSRFPRDDWNGTRRRQASLSGIERSLQFLKAKCTSKMKKTGSRGAGYNSHNRGNNAWLGKRQYRPKQEHPTIDRELVALSSASTAVSTTSLQCVPPYVDALQMLASVRQTIVDSMDSRGIDSRGHLSGVSSMYSVVDNATGTPCGGVEHCRGFSETLQAIPDNPGELGNCSTAVTWPISYERTGSEYRHSFPLLSTAWEDSGEGVAPLDVNVSAGDASELVQIFT